jgi:hypothetical protein
MGRTWLTRRDDGAGSPGLGPRSGSSRVCEGLPQTSSCALRPHNEIDVTVENLQQGDELIDGLTVVCLIQESIELGRQPSRKRRLECRSIPEIGTDRGNPDDPGRQ